MTLRNLRITILKGALKVKRNLSTRQFFIKTMMVVLQLHIRIYRGVSAKGKILEIPPASALEKIKSSKGELVNLICAKVKDSKVVKRTVCICHLHYSIKQRI
ncbi:MAG: hypothetical protein FWC12_11135 [Treponema sp.]|nr:hypothetical protein [Treponema sp.]